MTDLHLPGIFSAEIQTVTEAIESNPDMTVREVSDYTGVKVQTVRKIVLALAEQREFAIETLKAVDDSIRITGKSGDIVGFWSPSRQLLTDIQNRNATAATLTEARAIMVTKWSWNLVTY